MSPRQRRSALSQLAALVLFSLLLGSETFAKPPGHAPQQIVTEVAGLEAEVEILVDRYGVPHIYAAGQDDLFFAQGWNAARDRLWQLDLWKRRGDGTLSEVFGASFVEKDRAARLFLFRGDMHAEWLAYASDTKRIVSAFVSGVNAYIEKTRAAPEELPFEFGLLGYEPALSTPETVVRIRSHGLLWNAREEARRATFVRAHGIDALRHREQLSPPHAVGVPEGLDLDAWPDDVLAVYDLARSGVRFAHDGAGRLTLAAHVSPEEAPTRSGSNNWTVAPSRSASGRPMLANDPHRALSVPSLRYIAHLSAPGLDVIGAGEPALPGVSIGHNDRVAFGLTIFFIDQEDLYFYETRPGHPNEYRYRGRWEPMEIVRERVSVRDAAPVEVELAYTRHGPIVYRDATRRFAVAVRAAWLEPGMAPYLGSILSMRARNFDEFLAAMNRWGLPPENLVYADVDGNIGWKPGGLAPIRPNWDGLLPVPGDGRFEWAGFRDMDELPVEKNPARGFIATANHMNLPEGYPHALGYEWILPYRQQRILEVLSRPAKLTLEDLRRLQVDTLSVPARRVLALLAGLESERPEVARALAWLGRWDGRVDAGSGAAALFEVFAYRHLARAVMTRSIGDAPALARAVLDEDVLYDVFEGSSAEVWLARLEQMEGRDALLRDALAAAVQETEARLGPDWDAWQWGALHRAAPRHPASALLPQPFQQKLDIAPAPRGGSGATVMATSYTLDDFVQRYGASFRMVLDVGRWDDSLAMNTPGQSGDPESPHYKDLFESWSRDESFPLLYSRGRVEAATRHRLLLRPGNPLP